MVFPLLVSIAIVSAPGDPGSDAGSVLARSLDNINKIKDVYFLYEGKKRLLNVPPAEVGRRPNPSTRDFQGAFAYRLADDAIGWEIYEDAPETDLAQQHRIYALIGNQMEQVNAFADLDDGTPAVAKVPGVKYVIDMPYSPLRFMLFWRLLDASRDPATWDFRVIGPEEAEGHPCTVVEMNILEGAMFPDRPLLRMWLDPEAGGMPRQAEWRKNGLTTQRMRIESRAFPRPQGGDVWFPVRATIDSFSPEFGERPGDPYFHEETSVLDGSLKFDQGLTDKDFSIRPGSRIFSASKALASARRYEATPLKRDGAKVDPASVRERLETRLAEADAQSKELEASSSSAEVDSNLNAIRLPLAALGCAAVVAAVAWKIKTRPR